MALRKKKKRQQRHRGAGETRSILAVLVGALVAALTTG